MKTIDSVAANQSASAKVKLDVAAIDPRDAKIIARGQPYNKV
jgi:hypothetical protein